MPSNAAPPCHVACDPVWARLTAPPDAVQLVVDALTVDDPGARYVRAFQTGRWDGKVRYMQRPANRFLAGLRWRVQDLLEKSGYTVTTDDVALPSRSPLIPVLLKSSLRPYQEKAVDEALVQGRVALQSPTGCLDGDTLIDCPRDLTRYPRGIPIRELVGKRFLTFSWADDRMALRWADNVHQSGTKPVYRILLGIGNSSRRLQPRRLGGMIFPKYYPPLELVGTLDHPVLLADGTWKPLGELKEGDQLTSLYRRESKKDRTLIVWTGLPRRVSEQQFVCTEVNGPRPISTVVHHLNGNAYDHSPTNLEWKNSRQHKAEHIAKTNRQGVTGWQKTGSHPRGMAGKFQTAESRARISKGSVANWARLRAMGWKRRYSPEGLAGLRRRKRGRNGKISPKNHKVLSAPVYVGRRPVYDMSVDETHTFVANGIVVHNSGKTLIATEIVRRLGHPALWIVPRRKLMVQTAEVIREELGIRVGMIGDGICDPQDVTVAVINSLAIASPALVQRWPVLIIDEVHHAGAETWAQVIQSSPAQVRIGLSGTAETRDPNPVRAMRQEGLLGPIIRVEDTVTLVSQGFLANPRVVFLRPPTDSYPLYSTVRENVLPDWRRDPKRLQKLGVKLFDEAERLGIIENEERNREILNTAYRHVVKNNERVLILCHTIAHSERLAGVWSQMIVSHPVWRVDGKTHLRMLEAVLQQFRGVTAGALLVATPFFREGIDIPEIDALILAGGGMSEIASLQSIGRALRPRPDKQEVMIYDVWDGRRSAIAKERDRDYLADHADARLRTYQDQKFEVT